MPANASNQAAEQGSAPWSLALRRAAIMACSLSPGPGTDIWELNLLPEPDRTEMPEPWDTSWEPRASGSAAFIIGLVADCACVRVRSSGRDSLGGLADAGGGAAGRGDAEVRGAGGRGDVEVRGAASSELSGDVSSSRFSKARLRTSFPFIARRNDTPDCMSAGQQSVQFVLLGAACTHRKTPIRLLWLMGTR